MKINNTKKNIMSNSITLNDKKFFLKNKEKIPFQEILCLFVNIGFNKLLKKNPNIINYFTDNAFSDIQYFLLKRLSKIASETLYIKFCMTNTYSIKHFLGEITTNDYIKITTTIEYNKFINNMLYGELNAFFNEYPVLAEYISQTVSYWVDFITDFSTTFEKDYNKLCQKFFDGKSIGKISSLKLELSDNHNNNKTVILVSFRNKQNIIFKPRNISIEKEYYKLLAFFNSNNTSFQHKILKFIDGKTYGWVEFVEHLPCYSINDVTHYYKHAGSLLCIISILGGTDFHYENVIANNNTPVLIDLEMLMNNKKNNNSMTIDDLLERNCSILQSGLLPAFYIKNNGSISNLGGFGNNSSIQTTFKEPIWTNVNLDSMTLEFKYINVFFQKNNVSLNGKLIHSYDFVNDIIDGFKNTYITFIKLKNELLKPNSILYLFANQYLRYINRPTQNYVHLILNILKPPFFINKQQQQHKIKSLFYIISIFMGQQNKEILKDEFLSIKNLDIPYFKYKANKKNLILSSNNVIPNFFNKTSFDILIHTISNLSYQNIEEQCFLIKKSYKILKDLKTTNHNPLALPINDSILKQSTYKKNILEVRDSLMSKKIDYQKSVTWNQLELINNSTYITKIMGLGLYEGTAGIAIFLAATKKIFSSKNTNDIVYKILKPINEYFGTINTENSLNNANLGIANGLGGEIYTLTLTDYLMETNFFYKNTMNLIKNISDNTIFNDTILDVIGGCAGLLLSLLALYNKNPHEQILDLAIKCGNHLLNNRYTGSNGLRAWKNKQIISENNQPLCGFAHGASGISYALIKLFKLTKIKKFLYAAEEGIIYENSIILKKTACWPDLRKSQTEKHKLYNAWCNGAAGILITRLEALNLINKELINADINRAINIIINMPSKNNSLCCGTLGKVDVLLSASKKLLRPDLATTAFTLLEKENALFFSNNIFTNKNANYTFFQGIPGIVYTLLRFKNINTIPSVISFNI
ncbi:type 2 lanthipeptide synthetase LanM [Pectinatus sottacetonis]|uniref:type 2 lanthipeptide synthetase LanM n=1 Tax=Pectinatus sottacetonis TaxID=1002795 RepID=UPI0018C75304|nr:type 2 lanthipeptide synthetase LanM [Pectinatus sottacetonis]